MKRRVIYNDDFRMPMAFDQIEFNNPSTAKEWAELIERVRGTGINCYVMDSIEFDNKVYFATERGIDWAKIDFASFDGIGAYEQAWRDGPYARAARAMLNMRAEGHEPLQVFIDCCRDMGMEALAGIRMNDSQGVEPLSVKSPDVSFFLQEHPQYTIRFPGTDEPTRFADYAHKGLRDYRFSIIQELLEKFDYDGIEMNWLRFPFLFQPDYFCSAYGYITEDRFGKLAPIMTEWLVNVRNFLDELASKKGKDHMCFGVRVPETPEICRAVGIDLPSWISQAKLDYIVPSGFHSTNFNIPVERFKALCKGSECAVYPSMFPNVCHWPRTTRTYQTEVYAAAAQTYYGAGADGVEVFNHFHPSTKVIGLPFNAEALSVIASPESVQEFPEHHYYIAYSSGPADIPERCTIFDTGYRGTRLPVLPLPSRAKFEFRFGDDLAQSGRKLTCFRFKIFDMTLDDGPVTVFLNDLPLDIELTWRQRPIYRHTHIPSLDEKELSYKMIGWHTAKDSDSLELLAGEVIPPGEHPDIMELLDTPTFKRPEMLKAINDQGEGFSRDIFMLVEADTSAILPSALRQGLNRLWVQVEKQRDEAKSDLYMGELEIVTLL